MAQNWDKMGGPNGAPGASSTVPAGNSGTGYFTDKDAGNDGDGDENLNSGNGAGGAAGTPEGHADFVPG